MLGHTTTNITGKSDNKHYINTGRYSHSIVILGSISVLLTSTDGNMYPIRHLHVYTVHTQRANFKDHHTYTCTCMYSKNTLCFAHLQTLFLHTTIIAPL